MNLQKRLKLNYPSLKVRATQMIIVMINKMNQDRKNQRKEQISSSIRLVIIKSCLELEKAFTVII